MDIKKMHTNVVPKNAFISKSAKIKCNYLRVGNNATISDNVELRGDKIVIGDETLIGSKTKISGKLIQIGKNSTISENCDISVIENFLLGDRSDLCVCEIRGRNVKIGNDFFSSTEPNQLLVIGGGGSFLPTSTLTIGDRCTIHNVYINVAMPVKIGNDVGISMGTRFLTHFFWNSVFDGYPQKFAGITISNKCIIGADCLFLPGVDIGTDCIIGARSVITKKFPSHCMIGGNPAKIIKRNYRKKVPPQIRIKMIKDTLKWYNEILKSKGYSIKKLDNTHLKYQVISKDGILTKILYSSNSNEIKNQKNAIILSFQNYHVPSNCTLLNLSERTISGLENELTDDLRDFLRKVGIRIFSDRRFKSLSTKDDVKNEYREDSF